MGSAQHGFIVGGFARFRRIVESKLTRDADAIEGDVDTARRVRSAGWSPTDRVLTEFVRRGLSAHRRS
jgi:hypothetical protein